MNIADGFNFWVGHTFIPGLIGFAALLAAYFVLWKLMGGRVFKRRPKRAANTKAERTKVSSDPRNPTE